jgi:hypothetical protein
VNVGKDRTLAKKWKYLHDSLTTIMGNIKKASEELLRCKASISFWTDAFKGTAKVRYPIGSLSEDDVTRIFKHLPPLYVTQLRAEVVALPNRVNRSNLEVFRSL